MVGAIRTKHSLLEGLELQEDPTSGSSAGIGTSIQTNVVQLSLAVLD